jgi:hypothetical protein
MAYQKISQGSTEIKSNPPKMNGSAWRSLAPRQHLPTDLTILPVFLAAVRWLIAGRCAVFRGCGDSKWLDRWGSVFTALVLLLIGS